MHSRRLQFNDENLEQGAANLSQSISDGTLDAGWDFSKIPSICLIRRPQNAERVVHTIKLRMATLLPLTN